MILDVIVEDKLKRLPEHKNRISEEEMTRLAIESQRVSHSFYDALAKDGLSIISEFKKASPSHGNMNNKITLEERIKQYGESADAISCLTEEDHFKGSTEYLKQIRQMTDLPIIRKDFIIDSYQVYEAKVIGADAVLLIAAILDDSKFKELYDLAISCLTEEDHFKGSTEYLKQIRQMTDLPIIRKDFIIDSYQVYEAKVIGADAVLLIAAILDDSKFKELYDLAYSLGLDVLCEVHNEEEMQRMLNLDVKIIGINNRNLKTFEVDLDTTKKLADMVTPEMRKAGKLLVSESGVADTDDIKVLAKSGADALLIGTVLMEAPEPEELISEFKEVYNAERK